jgi:hypothetical protein
VGAVFIPYPNEREKFNSNFDTIICQNKTIGTVKPNKPIFKDNLLFCGEGTREIE